MANKTSDNDSEDDSSPPSKVPSPSKSDDDWEKESSPSPKSSPTETAVAPSPESLSSSDDSDSPQSSLSKTSPPPTESPASSPSSPPSKGSAPEKSSPSPSPAQPQPPPLPPPPPTSAPPPSSPPPSPSPASGNGDIPSPSPKQSPPTKSQASSPSENSSPTQPSSAPSNNSSAPGSGNFGNVPPPSFLVTPPGGSFPLKTFSPAPPLTPVVSTTDSRSNHLPSPHSPGISVGSHANTRGSSYGSLPSTSGDGGDNSGKYVGYAFAGVFMVAFIAIVLVVALKRSKKRGGVYDTTYMPPPPNKFPMKADGHYYVYGQQPGVANCLQDGNYGKGSQRGTVHPLGTPESAQPKIAQIAFGYENIKEITNGFDSQNVIGEGGFGCVYKGWLTNGRAVAVKQLKPGSGQGDREFRAEVEIISRVHHRHLVSLVGYCISEQQKVLIYEFVPNGTLNHHLHGSGMPVLDWTKRLKIAIGAAKGLAYLHEDCNPKIIHRDIKSANILLDDAYVAKVADFGLAKLNDDANTHVTTRVMGTFGYMAPEYATSGKLTDRSDVFSFGVVLLELVTGRKPVDQTQPVGDESLVEWARPLLIKAIETGDFNELIDPRLERHYVGSEMRRMIEAAAACIRHSAPKRPRMLQIVRALDSDGELHDLSNGVKYGQSTVYDSGQYDEEIMRFMMRTVSCGNSEFDMYSGEFSSREMSGTRHA